MLGDLLPRVTIVAHEVGTPGGMERQLGELVTGLLGRDYSVTVVAHECGLPAHPGLRVVRVPGPRRPFALWYPWFFLLGSLAAWRARGLLHTTGALVGNRADVSTVHFCHAAFQAQGGELRSARRSRAYRLNAWLSGHMSRAAERWCYRPARARRLVGVSEGMARELRDLFPAVADRVEVIPNGVDGGAFAPEPGLRARTRAELGLSGDDLVALFVGGDWERKGLRFAIEALRWAGDWRLLVVGKGDEQGERDRAGRLGVAERVLFAGHASDTAPFYASADAFVLPTSYEAAALVTYEAAAAGLPLLVSPVNGVEDVLVEGRSGWFAARDAAAIAARLEQLGADAGLRTRMGEAAREESARFDWRSVVESYDRLYRSLGEAAG